MTTKQKSAAEWKAVLPEDRYRVLFEAATEHPRSSPLNHEKRSGTYICAACHTPLFDAAQKYESGSGWPSFWAAIDAQNIATSHDDKLGVPRIEHHCAHCGGHLGHIFEDGPAPTGLRYCNNGLSMEFIPEGTPLPPPRK